jgi:hypothetical protein
MAKRKAESQIVNMTPDHEKFRIALIYLCIGGVLHTVRKISKKATTFLQTSFQLEVYTQNYGPPKLRSPNLRNFGTPTWESRDKMTFGCWS